MTQKHQSKWVIDAGHSEVQFKVKHLAISNVAGTFKLFKGHVLTSSEDFNSAKVQCIIDVRSLDTNNVQRDEHLRSDIFFDVQKFPEMIFDGELKRKNDNYELAGDLTIRDVIRPIVMEAEYTGTGKGRFNDTRAGF